MKLSGIVLGCILAAFGFLAGGAGAQVITEFSVGTAAPFDITAGPDGNLWFTETAGRIGRITPAGVVTEFSTGIDDGGTLGITTGITTGPDGNLWFTHRGGGYGGVPYVNVIGLITPLGVVTLLNAPFPALITSGPDGNLWFTESGFDLVGRITPLGVVTEFKDGGPAGYSLGSITAGPDGNLWFPILNSIGRITPDGVVTNFSAGIDVGANIGGITTGPDGNLWFTEPGVSRIGRITPPAVSRVGMGVDVHAASGTISNLNGMLEPGESVQVAPTWSVFFGPVTLSGTASNFGGPAGATYTLADSDAAYGTINTGAAANCHVATGNCYRMGVSNPATRPALHWDASFRETLSTGDIATILVHVGHSFGDVPDTDLMYRKIETLLHNQVTLGYGDGTFRPAAPSIRAATAIFVARGVVSPNGDGAIPLNGLVGPQPYNCIAGGTSLYVDVLPTDLACKHVHFIAGKAVNVSFQCTDSLHACPGDNTTRAAMAALIAGAITAGGDAAVPNAGTFTESGGPRSYDCGTAGGSHFPDVLATDPYCRHVNYLWALGVIDGYVDGTYQPDGMVTRGQMAKFITNGFALSLY